MDESIWIIEARDWKQDCWRSVFRTADEGEARYGLWNYVLENPGRIIRVRKEHEAGARQ